MNGKTHSVYSDYIAVSKIAEELRLSVKFTSAIPEGCSVVALTGIQFHKKETGKMYDLETKRALKIAEVF